MEKRGWRKEDGEKMYVNIFKTRKLLKNYFRTPVPTVLLDRLFPVLILLNTLILSHLTSMTSCIIYPNPHCHHIVLNNLFGLAC